VEGQISLVGKERRLEEREREGTTQIQQWEVIDGRGGRLATDETRIKGASHGGEGGCQHGCVVGRQGDKWAHIIVSGKICVTEKSDDDFCGQGGHSEKMSQSRAGNPRSKKEETMLRGARSANRVTLEGSIHGWKLSGLRGGRGKEGIRGQRTRSVRARTSLDRS